MTPEQALARLLSGTGISYRIQNGTVVVGTATTAGTAGGAAAADGSTVLQPIQVQGVAGGRGGAGEIIIGEREIERNNPTSLADVFRGEPGIQVGSSLPMSQKVYVHGVEETNLAVTIDGGRQGNKVFHHNATTLIDPGLLKLVDVDAGIAPADAGPGALAGGMLVFVSRMDDTINVSGLNVYPKDVEDAVMLMPGISDAVAFRKPDRFAGERVTLIFSAAEAINPLSVREWCSRNLASHQLPMEILQVGAVPRQANGKISRRQVAEMHQAGAFAAPAMEAAQ